MLCLWPRLHLRAGAFSLKRKLRPGIGAQNGMRFPVGASSGNCVPESMLRMGFTFLLSLWRKLCPGIRHQSGTHFPNSPSSGNCVPEFRSRLGCRFRLSLWRKVHPGIWLQNGTRFPKRPSSGNCVPECAPGMGCTFPMGWVSESVSHSEGSFRDALSARHAIWKVRPSLAGGHKLSSLYSSISLSHVGRMVWRMPAVCSFFASTPAERTSFMVKRMSGWP